MVVIWGSGLYGKVDEVPELCHVATRFGHLYYIPLLPLGSYAVFEKNGDDFSGAALPLSFKSILVAWLRAGMIVGVVAAAIFSLISFAERNALEGAAGIVLALMAIGLLWGSYSWSGITRANYHRAKQIAERCGVNPLGMLMIEVAYGRLTAAEADAELAKLHAAEEAAQPPIVADVAAGSY
jgi:hypothetical protein